MEQRLFQKGLEQSGIESVEIDEENKLLIHNAVMEAMVSGAIDQATREKIITLIETEKQRAGCDAVIMACSDIVRALQNSDVGIETINTIAVLADKVLASID